MEYYIPCKWKPDNVGVAVLISDKTDLRISLVAQWLRVLLPMQGTRFKPWSGKIPHAAEELGLCATAAGLAL